MILGELGQWFACAPEDAQVTVGLGSAQLCWGPPGLNPARPVEPEIKPSKACSARKQTQVRQMLHMNILVTVPFIHGPQIIIITASLQL